MFCLWNVPDNIIKKKSILLFVMGGLQSKKNVKESLFLYSVFDISHPSHYVHLLNFFAKILLSLNITLPAIFSTQTTV